MSASIARFQTVTDTTDAILQILGCWHHLADTVALIVWKTAVWWVLVTDKVPYVRVNCKSRDLPQIRSFVSAWISRGTFFSIWVPILSWNCTLDLHVQTWYKYYLQNKIFIAAQLHRKHLRMTLEKNKACASVMKYVILKESLSNSVCSTKSSRKRRENEFAPWKLNMSETSMILSIRALNKLIR